jgi:hypothetical protein
MRVEDLLQRLQDLSEMISQGRAGSPQKLAQKFGCSSRSIITYVNILRGFGQQIWYCRKSNAYLCSRKGRLEIRFVPDEELKKKSI